MELLKFRCPSCRKLFSADPRDLPGAQPKFQCPQCQVKFWVEVPSDLSTSAEAKSHMVAQPTVKPDSVDLPKEKANPTVANPAQSPKAEATARDSTGVVGTEDSRVEAGALFGSDTAFRAELTTDSNPFKSAQRAQSQSDSSAGSHSAGTASSHLDLDTIGKKVAGAVKACPRCKAEVEVGAKECHKCGVIFERLRAREFRPDPVVPQASRDAGEDGSVPQGLRDRWAEVLSQWDNKVLHDKFFQEVVAQSQIPYASRVYKKYLDKHPGDKTAAMMRDRIINFSVFSLVPERRGDARRKRFGFAGLVIVFGVALILIGLVIPAMRSVTAMGAAMLVLGVGMKYYLKL